MVSGLTKNSISIFLSECKIASSLELKQLANGSNKDKLKQMMPLKSKREISEQPLVGSFTNLKLVGDGRGLRRQIGPPWDSH
jgi:hypothetical protein